MRARAVGAKQILAMDAAVWHTRGTARCGYGPTRGWRAAAWGAATPPAWPDGKWRPEVRTAKGRDGGVVLCESKYNDGR